MGYVYWVRLYHWAWWLQCGAKPIKSLVSWFVVKNDVKWCCFQLQDIHDQITCLMCVFFYVCLMAKLWCLSNSVLYLHPKKVDLLMFPRFFVIFPFGVLYLLFSGRFGWWHLSRSCAFAVGCAKIGCWKSDDLWKCQMSMDFVSFWSVKTSLVPFNQFRWHLPCPCTPLAVKGTMALTVKNWPQRSTH